MPPWDELNVLAPFIANRVKQLGFPEHRTLAEIAVRSEGMCSRATAAAILDGRLVDLLESTILGLALALQVDADDIEECVRLSGGRIINYRR